MNDPSTKDRLKNLIAKSKEDKLIKELLALADHQPNDVSDQIFSLSAAYSKYTEEISFGTLRGEDERVTSNDLSRRMLMIINQLEEVDVDEQTEASTPPPLASSSSSATSKSAPFFLKGISLFNATVLILVVLGLIFWLSRSNTNEGDNISAEVWQDTWTQEIEASGGLVNSGIITFEDIDGSLIGKSEMKHNNGSVTEMTLYNITFDEHQKSMLGLWQSNEIEAEGTFKFSLKNMSSFKGSYTIHPDLETSFFWNGSR